MNVKRGILESLHKDSHVAPEEPSRSSSTQAQAENPRYVRVTRHAKSHIKIYQISESKTARRKTLRTHRTDRMAVKLLHTSEVYTFWAAARRGR